MADALERMQGTAEAVAIADATSNATLSVGEIRAVTGYRRPAEQLAELHRQVLLPGPAGPRRRCCDP